MSRELHVKYPQKLIFFKIAELQLRSDRQGFILFGKNRTHSLGSSVVHIPDGRMDDLEEKNSKFQSQSFSKIE